MTLPYEQHDARVLFWALFGVFALGEYAMRLRGCLSRSGTTAERWSLFVVSAAAALGIVGGLRLAKWNEGTVGVGRWPLFVLGLVLMAAGLGVRQWAILVLGRFFTVDVRVHADQTVVDRGPYRWVRHPSYSGLIVFFVGVGLALDNWASLLVLALVPTAGLLLRIRSEERALDDALGDPYRRYAARRRRLFPGIW